MTFKSALLNQMTLIEKIRMVSYLSLYDNSTLPDGAWQALLEEGAELWRAHVRIHFPGTAQKLEGTDANEIFHAYVEAKAAFSRAATPMPETQQGNGKL